MSYKEKDLSPLASKRPSHENESLGHLTPREIEVCKLVAFGHTNVEIAQILSISPRTVETHRTNIISKLDLKNRAELVRFAIDNDLMKTG